MKQIIQNMRDGKTAVSEVPIPSVRRKTALVRTVASLVSAGTERMVVEFAEKNLVGKAASRPDLVRQVISKARREGILPTIEATFNKLDQPMALGYSSAGVVIEVGEGLDGFSPGDRVACAGGGFAVHAEYGVIPQNLLTPIPDAVDFESAAFTTLGAIALQGFRLAQPQLGETVGIIGLGLLGLLSAEIAKAAGCQVFGIDLSSERVSLAEKMGTPAACREGCEGIAAAFTQNRGFDHLLICADTSSNDAVELAGILARDRGTIVAVGAVGMEIPRKIYYEKELDFRISRSYGPGRYDPGYEEGGQDYPFGYIRWTEGRNLAAFVMLLAQGKINIQPLISHRFEIDQAGRAYELITGKTGEPFLGVLVTYPQKKGVDKAHKIHFGKPSAVSGATRVGVLGAGNYAQAVFLPVIQKAGKSELVGIATSSGLSAAHAAQKFGFQFASSHEEDIFTNESINTLVILTRHQLHARQVTAGLQNKKAVYCEKPLALNEEELSQIERTLSNPDCPLLTVGFNRRFAPFARQLKDFLGSRGEAMSLHYRVNAGFLPSNHWLHDPLQGGGRIIGEGCHFIDLLSYLTDSKPIRVSAHALPDGGGYHQDNCTITLQFENGSVGTVTYLANGNKNFGKERVEVFCAGRIGILDDFRSLELITENKRNVFHSRFRQDKGHAASWRSFMERIEKNGEPPIPYDQLLSVSRACFAAVQSLAQNKEITL
ncbi:MAG: bi-domain-containing oxidoreductase [Chloroflexi bacterium]|nr:bi-domain-containing oxidoreductase [Chloroflexota bacterium]